MAGDIKHPEETWAHIDTLMKAGGQITLGQMAPLDGAAVAGDDCNLYVALRRRPNETVTELLQRLDRAVELAQHKGVRVRSQVEVGE